MDQLPQQQKSPIDRLRAGLLIASAIICVVILYRQVTAIEDIDVYLKYKIHTVATDNASSMIAVIFIPAVPDEELKIVAEQFQQRIQNMEAPEDLTIFCYNDEKSAKSFLHSWLFKITVISNQATLTYR